MNRPLIVLGGGGHAGVLIDALHLLGRELVGIVDPGLTDCAHGLEVLGGDEALASHPPSTVLLVNGIGSTKSLAARAEVFTRFKAKGYDFAEVIHPSATIARQASLGEGVQVMAGTVIQTGTIIGANSIVNTAASVDHDCRIGASVHIAPGARLSGSVSVEDEVHIGTGAIVIQNISIGRGSLVGAGAVVTEGLPAGARVAPVRSEPLGAA